MQSTDEKTGGCPFHGGALPEFPQPRDHPLAPPPQYTAWAGEAPLKKVRQWDGKEAWLILGYDQIRSLLTDKRVSCDSSHPDYPAQYASMQVVRRDYQTFISMDDPEHAYYRRMMTAEFAIRKVEAMRPGMIENIDRLIDAMLEKSEADLSAEFSYPLTLAVMCDFVGVPYEDREYFRDRLETMMSGKTDGDEAIAIGQEFIHGYIGDLIRRKEANPQDDVLSRLVVNHMLPGHLSFEQLKAMTRLLINAGHETTANNLNLSFLNLMEQRDQWDKMCANPDIIPGAVEELLRYQDVGHLGRRRFALEDIEIAGVTIRKGEGILALAMMGDHDPARFENPDVLDVERDARGQIAFGFGVHQCLGQSIARIELISAFQRLCARIPGIRLNASVRDLEFKDLSLAYGVETVPVTW